MAPSQWRGLVLSTVASYYELPVADLLGPRRLRDLSIARQMAMYLIIETNPSTTHAAIGATVNRERTTVLDGIRTMRGLIESDTRLRQEAGELRAILLAQSGLLAPTSSHVMHT